MKKIENSFVVSGFVGKDASIHQFSTASVARFSLAISRTEKNGEETNRISAFMNVEAWRKNENTSSFDRLVKGSLLTVEGYFKPEEWQDADGVKHNRVVLVATKFYEGRFFYAFPFLCRMGVPVIMFAIHRLLGIGRNSVAKVMVTSHLLQGQGCPL